MSKNKELFLNSDIKLAEGEEEGKLKGEFEGIAYSGKVIKRHGFFENLVTDIDSLKFKSKIPVFSNHSSDRVVGNAVLKKENNSILIKKGKLFKSSDDAQKIISYAEDGMDWELSIGLGSDYDVEFIMEKQSVNVNGQIIKGPANIIRNASIKEVSFVPVGADDKTKVQVFNDKGLEMTLEDQEKRVKELEASIEEIALACSCGGEKAETVVSKAKETVTKKEDLEKENDELKKQIDELKKELAEFKKEQKKSALLKAAENKIELSDEKVEAIINDEIKLENTLDLLKEMDPKKKIDPKFAEKVEIEEEPMDLPKQKKIEMAAKKLMDEQGCSRQEAFALLPDEIFES